MLGMTKWKWIKRGSISVVILILVGVFTIDYSISKNVENQVIDSTNDLPKNNVGLLLGTSKYVKSGGINQYYKYRIEAAVKLYQRGKIKFVLISGDNSTKTYDEPNTMRRDLIKKGIPKEKIYLDYAGFRTLDSVVRSNKVFNQDKITIISQKFHNERAVFIANFKGIEAIGYNAKDVGAKYGFKTKVREKLARVKVILDLIFGKQPKFLGETIQIK